jgi:hypothetical protein
MIALPEKATDPAIASAMPGHMAVRGAGVGGAGVGGAGTGGTEVAIDSPVIAAPCR